MIRWMSIICLALVFVGFQSPKVDFTGKWKLDFKRSKNLPESFRNVDSYVLDIDQSSDSMTVHATMHGMGQAVDFPPSVYRFDTTEVFREDTLRGSKRWTKASWTTIGQKLIVTSRVEQHQPGKPVQKYIETDVWQYGMKRALLVTVTQTFEGSDSTHSEQRAYTRMR